MWSVWCLSQDVDLNSLEEAPSVLGLLLCLFDGAHLGCLVRHELAEEMCGSTKCADPISVLASKMEKLTPKFRELFKNLLRFFGKVSECVMLPDSLLSLVVILLLLLLFTHMYTCVLDILQCTLSSQEKFRVGGWGGITISCDIDL